MGMYTEFDFNSDLKSDTPEEVINILKWMVTRDDNEPPTPDHPFFQCDRWQCLFTMDSFYFDANTKASFEPRVWRDGWVLNVRSNLKNYDSEIENFIDWIMPYLDKYEGDFLGFYRYEESEDPMIIKYETPQEIQ